MAKKPKRLIQQVKLKDIGGGMCAWARCEETFEDMLPEDWVWLMTHWSPKLDPKSTMADIALSPFCYLDIALCGAHARELKSLLKDLGPLR